MIEILGIKNAAKLVPTEDDALPIDPVQENQDLLTGKPVKAFIEQSHQAHIAVHMAAMQDPKIQQLMQMNPQAPAIQAAAMAHINEHIAFEYRKQIELSMGMPLPNKEQSKQVSPELADKIAMMAAQASAQLTQKNQQEAQQQQAQAQQQDPVIQIQQQELQLKQEELKLKQEKQKIDAAAKADQLRIEQSRIETQKEIAQMQVDATSATARDRIAKQQETDGARMGIDIAKQKAQMAQQQYSAMLNRQKQQQQPKQVKETK
jgi:hypothetical protein